MSTDWSYLLLIFFMCVHMYMYIDFGVIICKYGNTMYVLFNTPRQAYNLVTWLLHRVSVNFLV